MAGEPCPLPNMTRSCSKSKFDSESKNSETSISTHESELARWPNPEFVLNIKISLRNDFERRSNSESVFIFFPS